MSKTIYSLVGPPEKSNTLPVTAMGIVPSTHSAFPSLTTFANPAPLGSVVTHPDHIAQAIKSAVDKKVQEFNVKYDKAIEAAQAMLADDVSSREKKMTPTATLDRAQVAALLQIKDDQWERHREEWKQKEEQHEREEADYKRREQQWEIERADLYKLLRVDHAKMNKIRLQAFCQEVELYICACYGIQTSIQVAYLNDIASDWLDNFLTVHHLPRNVVEFLRSQLKEGSNIAHPQVRGREIRNILQAYLTLDFSTRERYDDIFAFYFGTHNIDYQPTLTALKSADLRYT